jgi:hypothetical protein
MRALLAFAALAFGGFRASAQARPVDSAKTPAPATGASQIAKEIEQRRNAGDKRLPDAENFTFGDRTISANTVVEGPIAIARGNLDVYGTIEGDVVALDGNVRVHEGGRIVGDAWAAGGTVLIEGGVVEGQKRSLAITRPAIFTPHPPRSPWQSAKLVFGWFAVLTIIGLGVMVFADSNLDGVVLALERGFSRSFWIGLTGQVAALPALLVLVVGLAITVLGTLLIPFAIVAYIIAAAGLVTLGFLAVARLAGGVVTSGRGTTSRRGANLRALISGLGIFLGLWMVAALFAWNPMAGAILRAVGIAVTWVAATVGLGAAMSSRAGTKRAGAHAKSTATDEFAWQTPTPVTGVAAATRRTASSTTR